MSRVRICVAWSYPSTRVAQKKQAFLGVFLLYFCIFCFSPVEEKHACQGKPPKACMEGSVAWLCRVCVFVFVSVFFVLCWRRGVVEVAPKQNISDLSYPPGWVVCSSSSAFFFHGSYIVYGRLLQLDMVRRKTGLGHMAQMDKRRQAKRTEKRERALKKTHLRRARRPTW